MIKKENVFIGTVNVCSNIDRYIKDGEYSDIYDFHTCHTKFGAKVSNISKKYEHQVLIKLDEDNYIWFKLIETKVDEILLNMGLYSEVLKTSPSDDQMLFVDSESLKPYYENCNDKGISIRKLRKELIMDARLPGGIEN